MGHGGVLAEFAIGAEALIEEVEVTIVRAPEREGHFALLFFANGGAPISAQVALPALLLPAPHTGSIDIEVPPVPSLPGAPNVAVAELNATLGPLGLTYYERIHGRTTSYHPPASSCQINPPRRLPLHRLAHFRRRLARHGGDGGALPPPGAEASWVCPILCVSMSEKESHVHGSDDRDGGSWFPRRFAEGARRALGQGYNC